MTDQPYRVVVERNRLKFAAAHMATYGGDLEPLHGHNYALHLEVAGTLSADAWVIDFRVLKRIGREICESLEHRFLLQGASESLTITRDETMTTTITFGRRRYVFPTTDVVDLPIDNTTVERLAEWIGGRVIEQLSALGAASITELTVGLEEAPGQSGWFRTSLGADRS
jgi:6-pyruvoyltetrahydropterin/6-carboxytetrahydropterin synthase